MIKRIFLLGLISTLWYGTSFSQATPDENAGGLFLQDSTNKNTTWYLSGTNRVSSRTFFIRPYMALHFIARDTSSTDSVQFKVELWQSAYSATYTDTTFYRTKTLSDSVGVSLLDGKDNYVVDITSSGANIPPLPYGKISLVGLGANKTASSVKVNVRVGTWKW